MAASSRARVRTWGALLAAAYLLLVAGLELLQRTGGWPRPGALASSPAGIAAGNVWALVTSGLVIDGPPVVQLAGTAVTAFAVLELLGATAFWAAVAIAHLGSAVIAYAGVGVLWLVAGADVDAVVDAPDYGISCVWAGAAGALLTAVLAARGSRLRIAALVGGAALLVAGAPGDGLAGVEHGLAFVLGGLTAVALGRRGARAVASAPA
jgi:hypothetical protein